MLSRIYGKIKVLANKKCFTVKTWEPHTLQTWLTSMCILSLFLSESRSRPFCSNMQPGASVFHKHILFLQRWPMNMEGMKHWIIICQTMRRKSRIQRSSTEWWSSGKSFHPTAWERYEIRSSKVMLVSLTLCSWLLKNALPQKLQTW